MSYRRLNGIDVAVKILYLSTFQLVARSDPYLAVHLDFIWNTPTQSRNNACGPVLTKPEIVNQNIVTNFEGKSFK